MPKYDGSSLIFTLSQSGISCNIELLNEYDKKFVNYFKIKQTDINGYIKYVFNHERNIKRQNYIFPRFGAMQYIAKRFVNYTFIDKLFTGDEPDAPFKWTGTYTSNQKIIAKYILKNHFIIKTNKQCDIQSNINKGLILNLEAGQGKTFLAIGLIEKIKKKTLVVCHNKSIMFQWVKILKQAYPDNEIGCFYGKAKEDGDIIVGVINCLIMQKKSFFGRFGFTILDEVHEYCSKTRKTIYKLASSQFMLGLSATPNERIDGLDNVNIWNCGNIVNAVDIPGFKMDDVQFKGEITMIKYIGHPDYTKIITNEKLEIVSFSKMINQICEDPYRLKIIVDQISHLISENKNILVFADRISYLESIQTELNKLSINGTILDTKKLVGGSSADDIEYAKNKSNVILSTYQYFGTGVSIQKLDSVILTTPRKRKSKQYIGRIFRLGSDENIVRKIIDIVDWSVCMKNQWYLRKKYYEEMGYPITIKKIEYNDVI